MHQRQRHQRIEDEVDQHGLVTIEQLVGTLNASPATVRRDVVQLAASGRIRRVRGGVERARSSLHSAHFEPNRFKNAAAKFAIAEHAASLCSTGESIIVNGGTTTYQMVPHIADQGLNVLTNSFPFAAQLTARGNCRVTLPGGEIYREQNLIVSPYESDTVIDHFYASKIFTSAQSIRPQGLIEGDPLLIKSERKLIKQADQLVALIDGSKFKGHGSMILCALDRVDLLITDETAPPEALAMLKDSGVEIVVVALDQQRDKDGRTTKLIRQAG